MYVICCNFGQIHKKSDSTICSGCFKETWRIFHVFDDDNSFSLLHHIPKSVCFAAFPWPSDLTQTSCIVAWVPVTNFLRVAVRDLHFSPEAKKVFLQNHIMFLQMDIDAVKALRFLSVCWNVWFVEVHTIFPSWREMQIREMSWGKTFWDCGECGWVTAQSDKLALKDSRRASEM